MCSGEGRAKSLLVVVVLALVQLWLLLVVLELLLGRRGRDLGWHVQGETAHGEL